MGSVLRRLLFFFRRNQFGAEVARFSEMFGETMRVMKTM